VVAASRKSKNKNIKIGEQKLICRRRRQERGNTFQSISRLSFAAHLKIKQFLFLSLLLNTLFAIFDMSSSELFYVFGKYPEDM